MPETHLHESAGVWNSASGSFINADHQRLASVLADYSAVSGLDLSLVWIPPKDRDATDTKPYAILNRPKDTNRPPTIIRYLSEREMQDPAAILAWVFEGDTTRHGTGTVFANLEKKRQAQELLEQKQRADELEDILDFGGYIFGDRAPFYAKHDGVAYNR